MPGECDRQGHFLNGEGAHNAHRGECIANILADPKIGKGLGGRLWCRGRLGLIGRRVLSVGHLISSCPDRAVCAAPVPVRECAQVLCRVAAQVLCCGEHGVFTTPGWREVKEADRGKFIFRSRALEDVPAVKELRLSERRGVWYIKNDRAST